MKQFFEKEIPRDVSLGVLMAIMVTIVAVVVLPALYVIKVIPMHYYNLMPAANNNDSDRDGIVDVIDVTPYGTSYHAAPSDEVVK